MRNVQGINTGSMADIAFLLLVFFLVTANIQQDYGISSNISKPFETPDSLSIIQSMLMINSSGNYMLNGDPVNSTNLTNEILNDFNHTRNTKNVLIVKSDRDVVFDDFLAALDASKRAFRLYYDQIALEEYNDSYYKLTDSIQTIIRGTHPVALCEDVLEN